jgi:hypothetical protein
MVQLPDSAGRYKHLITGHISGKPEDMLGGIIADGMGLGKTLTMIASVVASLPRADEFEARGAPDGSSTIRLPPVKATLVIVPSVCKFVLTEKLKDGMLTHYLQCCSMGGSMRSGSMYPSSHQHLRWPRFG